MSTHPEPTAFRGAKSIGVLEQVSMEYVESLREFRKPVKAMVKTREGKSQIGT